MSPGFMREAYPKDDGSRVEPVARSIDATRHDNGAGCWTLERSSTVGCIVNNKFLILTLAILAGGCSPTVAAEGSPLSIATATLPAPPVGLGSRPLHPAAGLDDGVHRGAEEAPACPWRRSCSHDQGRRFDRRNLAGLQVEEMCRGRRERDRELVRRKEDGVPHAEKQRNLPDEL
jgi:hypothetical protein